MSFRSTILDLPAPLLPNVASRWMFQWEAKSSAGKLIVMPLVAEHVPRAQTISTATQLRLPAIRHTVQFGCDVHLETCSPFVLRVYSNPPSIRWLVGVLLCCSSCLKNLDEQEAGKPRLRGVDKFLRMIVLQLGVSSDVSVGGSGLHGYTCTSLSITPFRVDSENTSPLSVSFISDENYSNASILLTFCAYSDDGIHLHRHWSFVPIAEVTDTDNFLFIRWEIQAVKVLRDASNNKAELQNALKTPDRSTQNPSAKLPNESLLMDCENHFLGFVQISSLNNYCHQKAASQPLEPPSALLGFWISNMPLACYNGCGKILRCSMLSSIVSWGLLSYNKTSISPLQKSTTTLAPTVKQDAVYLTLMGVLPVDLPNNFICSADSSNENDCGTSRCDPFLLQHSVTACWTNFQNFNVQVPRILHQLLHHSTTSLDTLRPLYDKELVVCFFSCVYLFTITFCATQYKSAGFLIYPERSRIVHLSSRCFSTPSNDAEKFNLLNKQLPALTLHHPRFMLLSFYLRGLPCDHKAIIVSPCSLVGVPFQPLETNAKKSTSVDLQFPFLSRELTVPLSTFRLRNLHQCLAANTNNWYCSFVTLLLDLLYAERRLSEPHLALWLSILHRLDVPGIIVYSNCAFWVLSVTSREQVRDSMQHSPLLSLSDTLTADKKPPNVLYIAILLSLNALRPDSRVPTSHELSTSWLAAVDRFVTRLTLLLLNRQLVLSCDASQPNVPPFMKISQDRFETQQPATILFENILNTYHLLLLTLVRPLPIAFSNIENCFVVTTLASDVILCHEQQINHVFKPKPLEATCAANFSVLNSCNIQLDEIAICSRWFQHWHVEVSNPLISNDLTKRQLSGYKPNYPSLQHSCEIRDVAEFSPAIVPFAGLWDLVLFRLINGAPQSDALRLCAALRQTLSNLHPQQDVRLWFYVLLLWNGFLQQWKVYLEAHLASNESCFSQSSYLPYCYNISEVCITFVWIISTLALETLALGGSASYGLLPIIKNQMIKTGFYYIFRLFLKKNGPFNANSQPVDPLLRLFTLLFLQRGTDCLIESFFQPTSSSSMLMRLREWLKLARRLVSNDFLLTNGPGIKKTTVLSIRETFHASKTIVTPEEYPPRFGGTKEVWQQFKQLAGDKTLCLQLFNQLLRCSMRIRLSASTVSLLDFSHVRYTALVLSPSSTSLNADEHGGSEAKSRFLLPLATDLNAVPCSFNTQEAASASEHRDYFYTSCTLGEKSLLFTELNGFQRRHTETSDLENLCCHSPHLSLEDMSRLMSVANNHESTFNRGCPIRLSPEESLVDESDAELPYRRLLGLDVVGGPFVTQQSIQCNALPQFVDYMDEWLEKAARFSIVYCISTQGFARLLMLISLTPPLWNVQAYGYCDNKSRSTTVSSADPATVQHSSNDVPMHQHQFSWDNSHIERLRFIMLTHIFNLICWMRRVVVLHHKSPLNTVGRTKTPYSCTRSSGTIGGIPLNNILQELLPRNYFLEQPSCVTEDKIRSFGPVLEMFLRRLITKTNVDRVNQHKETTFWKRKNWHDSVTYCCSLDAKNAAGHTLSVVDLGITTRRTNEYGEESPIITSPDSKEKSDERRDEKSKVLFWRSGNGSYSNRLKLTVVPPFSGFSEETLRIVGFNLGLYLTGYLAKNYIPLVTQQESDYETVQLQQPLYEENAADWKSSKTLVNRILKLYDVICNPGGRQHASPAESLPPQPNTIGNEEPPLALSYGLLGGMLLGFGLSKEYQYCSAADIVFLVLELLRRTTTIRKQVSAENNKEQDSHVHLVPEENAFTKSSFPTSQHWRSVSQVCSDGKNEGLSPISVISLRTQRFLFACLLLGLCLHESAGQHSEKVANSFVEFEPLLGAFFEHVGFSAVSSFFHSASFSKVQNCSDSHLQYRRMLLTRLCFLCLPAALGRTFTSDAAFITHTDVIPGGATRLSPLSWDHGVPRVQAVVPSVNQRVCEPRCSLHYGVHCPQYSLGSIQAPERLFWDAVVELMDVFALSWDVEIAAILGLGFLHYGTAEILVIEIIQETVRLVLRGYHPGEVSYSLQDQTKFKRPPRRCCRRPAANSAPSLIMMQTLQSCFIALGMICCGNGETSCSQLNSKQRLEKMAVTDVTTTLLEFLGANAHDMSTKHDSDCSLCSTFNSNSSYFSLQWNDGLLKKNGFSSQTTWEATRSLPQLPAPAPLKRPWQYIKPVSCSLLSVPPLPFPTQNSLASSATTLCHSTVLPFLSVSDEAFLNNIPYHRELPSKPVEHYHGSALSFRCGFFKNSASFCPFFFNVSPVFVSSSVPIITPTKNLLPLYCSASPRHWPVALGRDAASQPTSFPALYETLFLSTKEANGAKLCFNAIKDSSYANPKRARLSPCVTYPKVSRGEHTTGVFCERSSEKADQETFCDDSAQNSTKKAEEAYQRRYAAVLVPGAYIFLSLCYLDAAESDYTESLRTVLTEVYPKEDLELRVFFQVLCRLLLTRYKSTCVDANEERSVHWVYEEVTRVLYYLLRNCASSASVPIVEQLLDVLTGARVAALSACFLYLGICYAGYLDACLASRVLSILYLEIAPSRMVSQELLAVVKSAIVSLGGSKYTAAKTNSLFQQSNSLSSLVTPSHLQCLLSISCLSICLILAGTGNAAVAEFGEMLIHEASIMEAPNLFFDKQRFFVEESNTKIEARRLRQTELICTAMGLLNLGGGHLSINTHSAWSLSSILAFVLTYFTPSDASCCPDITTINDSRCPFLSTLLLSCLTRCSEENGDLDHTLVDPSPVCSDA